MASCMADAHCLCSLSLRKGDKGQNQAGNELAGSFVVSARSPTFLEQLLNFQDPVQIGYTLKQG